MVVWETPIKLAVSEHLGSSSAWTNNHATVRVTYINLFFLMLMLDFRINMLNALNGCVIGSLDIKKQLNGCT